MTIPNFAPGCFGSALAFDDTNAVCRACKFIEQCRPVHLENKARLHAELGIREKRIAFEMKKASERNPNPGAKVLPKKVVELIERIDGMKLDIVGKMNAGKNPFPPDTLKYLYLAAHVFISLPPARVVRANMMTGIFARKLKCSTKTADSYVRMALQVLQHVGAIVEVDGCYALKRISQ